MRLAGEKVRESGEREAEGVRSLKLYGGGGEGGEEERLQLKSVKRVAEKLPGKQLASHVLWPLHSRRF